MDRGRNGGDVATNQGTPRMLAMNRGYENA